MNYVFNSYKNQSIYKLKGFAAGENFILFNVLDLNLKKYIYKKL